MTPEAIRLPEHTKVEVIAGLKAVHDRGLLEGERYSTPEFEILREYIAFYEAKLDAQTQNPIEGAFHRLDFTYNLATIYGGAGYREEMHQTILPAMRIVLTYIDSPQVAGTEIAVYFEELYTDMYNYFFNVDPNAPAGSVTGGPDEHWHSEI